MALKTPAENKAQTGSLVKPGKRLFLNSDRDRLVEADDPDRRYLFCTEHQRVRRDEFERLSAAGGGKKASTKAKPKAPAAGGEKGEAKGE